MAGVSAGLAFAMVKLDTWLGTDTVRDFGWLYTFGPEGARAILSTIAGSMITVAGLTFSITMLTLQLATSQFGPRLLRNFMRDRGNQFVLGTFIATFVYCLLVLRTVRGTEEVHFVAHIAVAVGVLLALASIAVLIYFIHHVAVSIRIETLLATLSAETRVAIDHLYPERIGRDPSPRKSELDAGAVPGDFNSNLRLIRSRHGGYLQRVDANALMRIAVELDLIVRVEASPGHFATEGDALLAAYPRERVSDEAADRLWGALMIGQERTPHQDLEFSIRRIVEIAQRALSPGINDPTTALYCIDRLGEALGRLAERDIPSPFRFDQDGRLRTIAITKSLDEIACPALAAVARYGVRDADVIAKLLDTMEVLVRAAPSAAADTIADLADAIRREGDSQVHLGSAARGRVRADAPS